MVHPPLPASPPPPLPSILDVSSTGPTKHRSEIRIITDEVISPVISPASVELTVLGGKTSNEVWVREKLMLSFRFSKSLVRDTLGGVDTYRIHFH